MSLPWQACSSKLVGRSDELEHLRSLVGAVHGGGAGGLVLVSGEAGIGKSRLVREVAATAEDRGVQVLTGRAVPACEPYRPLVEAMSSALRDRPLPDDDTLRPYLPVLAAVLPDAEVSGRVDPRGGVVLGEAILRLITALAGEHGALVVLEDLHWADPDTLPVLTYLAHAAESTPLLLLVTAREEDGPPEAVMEMVSACQASVLPLGRLHSDDVREVVESCLAGRPPDEVVAFALENADGLPLLVEELLTGLGTVGALTQDGKLVGPLAPGVPRTFAATVRRRVGDLDESARTVVQAAAVLGRRFDWSLLPEVTGLPRTEVLAGLRAAVRTGLVEVDGPETFRFKHALTGDAIRDDLLPPERRALARSAAEIVERRDPEAYALAAQLRAAAGDEPRAAELSVCAGRQAARRGALHSADLLLTRAAELAGDGAELRGLAERALLDVLAAKGDAERALALGERLLAAGDAGVRLVLAQVAADVERWDVVAAYLSAVPDDGDPRVGVLAARLAHARGRPEQAREMAEAALVTARKEGRWSVACQALEVIGRAARIDDTDAARDAFAGAERLAAEHDLPLCRVSALHELGTVDLLVDGSTSRLERARALAVDSGALGLAATLDLQISAGPAAPRHRPRADVRRPQRRPGPPAAGGAAGGDGGLLPGDRLRAPRRDRGGRALRRRRAPAGTGRPGRQRRHLGGGPGARGAAHRRPGAARGVPGPGGGLPAAQPDDHADPDPRAVGTGPHAGRPGRRAGPRGGPPVDGELGERGAAGVRGGGRGRPARTPAGRRPAARHRGHRARRPDLVAAPGPAAGGRRGAGRTAGATRSAGPGRRCRSSPAGGTYGWPAGAGSCCAGPAHRSRAPDAATRRCRPGCGRSG